MSINARPGLLLLLLVATPLLRADEAPRLIANPDEPSAWACTVDTLDQSTDCFLDALDTKAGEATAQARDNVAKASALAPKLCGRASRKAVNQKPDADLNTLCTKDFLEAANDKCSLDGTAVLADAKGRFTPDAKRCYAALASVLRRTRTLAALALGCCQCLAKKCTIAAPQCLAELGAGEPGDPMTSCLEAGSCVQACTNVLPEPPRRAPPDTGGKTRVRDVEWL